MRGDEHCSKHSDDGREDSEPVQAIGPEKPRNSAVFGGLLCTLGWRRRLGIAL